MSEISAVIFDVISHAVSELYKIGNSILLSESGLHVPLNITSDIPALGGAAPSALPSCQQSNTDCPATDGSLYFLFLAVGCLSGICIIWRFVFAVYALPWKLKSEETPPLQCTRILFDRGDPFEISEIEIEDIVDTYRGSPKETEDSEDTLSGSPRETEDSEDTLSGSPRETEDSEDTLSGSPRETEDSEDTLSGSPRETEDSEDTLSGSPRESEDREELLRGSPRESKESTTCEMMTKTRVNLEICTDCSSHCSSDEH